MQIQSTEPMKLNVNKLQACFNAQHLQRDVTYLGQIEKMQYLLSQHFLDCTL